MRTKKDTVNLYMLPLLEKLIDTEKIEADDSCHWVTSINRGDSPK